MIKRRVAKLLALAVVLSIFAAACGSSSDEADTDADANATDPTTADSDTTEGTDGGEETAAGGELIDGGTFVGDPPEHIDPALNTTLDAYQVVNALYDGLTDIDATDPLNPQIVPDVASEIAVNDDATVWTFTIRDDEFFSDGTQVLPSTFAASWNRAVAMAGDYSYLMGFIDGGTEALEGTATELSGVAADDDAMTLTVTLDEPYANFDAVAGFQLFMPVHPETADLEDQTTYENGIMIGNGPFMMEAARTDEEIVLVPNPEWNGSISGTTAPSLERITFKTLADPDTSYNALEAGENDTGQIPPGRVTEAADNWGNTLDTSILGSYHWVTNSNSELIGGADNLKLREAIGQAINRDEINEAVYNNSRTISTGVTPPGIPGYKEGLCTVCEYNQEAAQAAFDEWTAAGGSLAEPITLQFNADAGHEPVAQIMIDNLAAIGIEAVAEPMDGETYFSVLSDGGCKHICRLGWFADYPTYDNFMYDLFHGDSIGGNNNGPFVNAEFDSLVDEAKQTTDKDAAAKLYQDAETILLNDVGVIPVNWYKGDYAYDAEKITNFPQNNFGLVLWEDVTMAG